MHAETKSECVQQPTQHINPVFVFELSIVLLYSERWLGRFGVLNASVRFTSAEVRPYGVSRVSLLGSSPNS